MKVSLISTWDTQCGIASYTKGLRQGLDGIGVETRVFPIDRPQMNALGDRALVAAFASLARAAASAGDVVHLQHEHGILAARRQPTMSFKVLRAMLDVIETSGTPLVMTWHSDPLPLSRRPPKRPRNVTRWLTGHRDWRALVAAINDAAFVTTLAHSTETREAFQRAGVDPRRIQVVPHGLAAFNDRMATADDKASLRQIYGVPRDATVMTLFGFVERYKGYRTAIAALEQMPANYYFVVAGGPNPLAPRTPEFDYLKELLGQNADLADRVRLTGYLTDDELRDYFSLTDVCIAPYEGDVWLSSSGALTDAIASGNPVVASDIRSFQEVQRNSGCLLLIPPDDPQALANAVVSISGDEAARARLRAAAADYCERFGWSRTAETHRTIYEAALEAAGSGRVENSERQLAGTL